MSLFSGENISDSTDDNKISSFHKSWISSKLSWLVRKSRNLVTFRYPTKGISCHKNLFKRLQYNQNPYMSIFFTRKSRIKNPPIRRKNFLFFLFFCILDKEFLRRNTIPPFYKIYKHSFTSRINTIFCESITNGLIGIFSANNINSNKI